MLRLFKSHMFCFQLGRDMVDYISRGQAMKRDHMNTKDPIRDLNIPGQY